MKKPRDTTKRSTVLLTSRDLARVAGGNAGRDTGWDAASPDSVPYNDGNGKDHWA